MMVSPNDFRPGDRVFHMEHPVAMTGGTVVKSTYHARYALEVVKVEWPGRLGTAVHIAEVLDHEK